MSGADTDAPKEAVKLDEADGIGANFDAAAVTVAAGTATLVGGSDARGA